MTAVQNFTAGSEHPFAPMATSMDASLLIIIAGVFSLFWAFVNYMGVKAVDVVAIDYDTIKANADQADASPDSKLLAEKHDDEADGEEDEEPYDEHKANEAIRGIHQSITDGAQAFLWAEYKYLAVFIVIFSAIVVVLVGSATNCGAYSVTKAALPRNVTLAGQSVMLGVFGATTGVCWTNGVLTMITFVLGGTTSILSGYIGMKIAVYANARTTCAAQHSWKDAFNCAFRAGAVMGFCLCGLALLVLYVIITALHANWPQSYLWSTGAKYLGEPMFMFEAIAGYGLGGSSIALFGRVGGGIYTKAADVGADLVGKVENSMDEDDPRNPACIADNVGDNVGDVAGMGADLFGSFAEATCAALVISANSPDLSLHHASMMFPLAISATGIIGCALTSLIATHIKPVKNAKGVEDALRIQMIFSTIITTCLIAPVAYSFLPSSFCVAVNTATVPNAAGLAPKHWFSWVGANAEVSGQGPIWCLLVSTRGDAFACVAAGLWGGLAIGYFTDYMTSNHHGPVKELASVCSKGAAVNIIYGMSLGNFSTIVPAIALALVIFMAFFLAHMYGIALAALGMLSTLSIGLTIDAYGPVCDNAGGIAEMSHFPKEVRERTDILDAAGNTTAAIGKGFAIGSAALVSLALFGAFVTRTGLTQVNILTPITFSGLLIGAMLPYWFSAMCLRSVGKAAELMVEEVRRQFKEIPGILTGEGKPETDKCIMISTDASLKEMMGPGALVMGTPILMGFFLGVNSVTGLLAGAMVSGVQMAISSSNMGGAWDNAKKHIEAGNHGGKHTDAHRASVVGDTVGDPLKDTSGPSLNILMKLMAIISLVFADFFTTNSLPVLLKSTAF